VKRAEQLAPAGVYGSRRALLGHLGLLMLAPGVGAAAAAAGQMSGSIASAASGRDPAQLLRDSMRMRGSPEGTPVMWVYSGALVVKPEGQIAREVARIEGLSFTRLTARDDGAYDLQLEEVGYFCDLFTGKVLETLVNPVTGVQVHPRHYRSPQQLRFSGTLVQPVMQLPPGIEFRGEVTRLAQVGGVVATTEDLYVKVPGRPAAENAQAQPERISTSLATFICAASDLKRADSEWIDCTFSYTTLNSFVGWLQMSSMPGVQNMRLIGAKCRTDERNAVPAALRARIADDHPDFLASWTEWE